MKSTSDPNNGKYPGDKKPIVIILIIAGLILMMLARSAITACHRTLKKVPEEKKRTLTVMKIEVQNTDLIESDYSRVAILDYENVIITAPKIYSDGRIQDDEIDIYADEDYQVVLKYNGESIITKIHLGHACEQGYLMKIDYATGTVDVSRNENI